MAVSLHDKSTLQMASASKMYGKIESVTEIQMHQTENWRKIKIIICLCGGCAMELVQTLSPSSSVQRAHQLQHKCLLPWFLMGVVGAHLIQRFYNESHFKAISYYVTRGTAFAIPYNPAILGTWIAIIMRCNSRQLLLFFLPVFPQWTVNNSNNAHHFW